MQARNGLLQLFRQLRPTHYIKTSTPLPQHRLFSNQAPSAIIPTPLLLSQTRRLPPLLASPISRLLHTSSPRLSSPSPSVPTTTTDPSTSLPSSQESQPQYQLTFTCKPCTHRSTHTISKHGYEKGTILITCPNCKNRHVVSDHLKIFSDTRITLENIMREKGELVKRGRVTGVDGEDVEFYPENAEGRVAR